MLVVGRLEISEDAWVELVGEAPDPWSFDGWLGGCGRTGRTSPAPGRRCSRGCAGCRTASAGPSATATPCGWTSRDGCGHPSSASTRLTWPTCSSGLPARRAGHAVVPGRPDRLGATRAGRELRPLVRRRSGAARAPVGEAPAQGPRHRDLPHLAGAGGPTARLKRTYHRLRGRHPFHDRVRRRRGPRDLSGRPRRWPGQLRDPRARLGGVRRGPPARAPPRRGRDTVERGSWAGSR